jgi:hypothetical protein
MDELTGTVVLIVALVLVAGAVVILIASGFARAPIEKKYDSAGAGLGAGLDAVWAPTAHEAGTERDRQTQRTAPAPSPGDAPGEMDDGHIRVDV